MANCFLYGCQENNTDVYPWNPQEFSKRPRLFIVQGKASGNSWHMLNFAFPILLYPTRMLFYISSFHYEHNVQTVLDLTTICLATIQSYSDAGKKKRGLQLVLTVRAVAESPVSHDQNLGNWSLRCIYKSRNVPPGHMITNCDFLSWVNQSQWGKLASLNCSDLLNNGGKRL